MPALLWLEPHMPEPGGFGSGYGFIPSTLAPACFKGAGFSPYIIRRQRQGALAPEGSSHGATHA